MMDEKGKAMTHGFRNQKGSVGGWIITIIILVLVIIGGYLTAIRFGLLPIPEILLEQSWMATFIPPVEDIEELDRPVIDPEESLRQQLVLINGQLMAAEAQIKTLEEDVAELERQVTEREDEIARLRDTINLASDQNISNVALIYENMDASDAAKILSHLGADSASLILSNMRESKAADVLSEMDETLATQITQLMAGFTGGLYESVEVEEPQESP